MATSNIFSILSLDAAAEEDEEDKKSGTSSSSHSPASSSTAMPATKPSSKVRKKKKKKNKKVDDDFDPLQGLVSTLVNLNVGLPNGTVCKEPPSSSASSPSLTSQQQHKLQGSSFPEPRDLSPSSSKLELVNKQTSLTSNQPQAAAQLSRAPSRTELDQKRTESSSFLKWPLVWIDLEMTGLNVDTDRILEIACIITDGRLQKSIEGPDLIINQPEESLAGMGEWCRVHHAANGLAEGVRKSNVTERQAEQEVLDFVRQHIGTGSVQPLLAGNSVYVDFIFLRKYMPELASLFSHVVVDVSSIKALCLRWFPKDAERAPMKKKKHRALEDIKESIIELKYMQKTIFKECKTRSS